MNEIHKQLRDQLAHFLVAILILFPAVFHPGILSCAWAGFGIGMVREVTQRGDPVTLTKVWHTLSDIDFTGTSLDLIFWLLGGVFTGIILHTVQ